MKRCQMKKGFFVLKECGDVAVAQCYNCKKHFCIAHCQNYFKSPSEEEQKAGLNFIKEPNDPDKIICVECYALQHKQELSEKYASGYQQTSHQNDILWYLYMRDSFYSSSQYKPFDSYDAKGFGSGQGSDLDESDAGGGFYDS
jgi:hypothetical protein